MKTMKSKFPMLMILGLIASSLAYSQASAESIEKEMKKHKTLHTYVIEREMPGAHNLSAEELKGTSKTSNAVVKELGPDIIWLHSYVAEDKIYCVYQAANKELVKKHAEEAGFPANSIKEVAEVISPKTAD